MYLLRRVAEGKPSRRCLSEDVDTIMFGCRTKIHDWTAPGKRGNKSPTDVNVYTQRPTRGFLNAEWIENLKDLRDTRTL